MTKPLAPALRANIVRPPIRDLEAPSPLNVNTVAKLVLLKSQLLIQSVDDESYSREGWIFITMTSADGVSSA